MFRMKSILIIGIFALAANSSNSASIESNFDCACTREYSPVCAVNGVTYSNRCVFECAKEKNSDLKIKFEGECEVKATPLEPACICPMSFMPVCGSDGVTYANECTLKCQQQVKNELKISHTGICPEKMNDIENICLCTFEYNPVCGSDGHSYDSKCELDCENKAKKSQITVAHKGACQPKIASTPLRRNGVCVCPAILAPVCGSNGKTYSNKCALNCARVEDGDLHVAYTGVCGVECFCTMEYKPLCGSDGHTYSNQCEFQCVQKRVPAIKVIHSGECN